MLYNISMTVTDQRGTEIDSSKYTLTDSNGISLGNVSLKDLVGKTEGFYIKLDSSLAEYVDIQIQIKYYNTTKNLWLQGEETTSQVKLNAEQPIAELSREETTTTIQFTTEEEEIETTEITVEKIWDDHNNQDGIRANSINISLLADGVAVEGKTLQLSDANNWKATFIELPVYANGTKINYTIEETSKLDNYEEPVITGNMETGFKITNKHIPEVTQIPVEKIWEDSENQDGKRPSSISVNLLANGTVVKGKSLELNVSNNWKGTFSNIPVYSNGTKITYTVAEVNLPEEYTAEIIGDSKTGFKITNKYIPEIIQISVEKIWNDNGNQDGIRPNTINVTLLANGTEVSGKTAELSDTNNWKNIFTNLPAYSNGTKIQYTISELKLPEGYTSKTTGDSQTGFVITNTHIPEVTQIPVEKIWDDGENQDGKRPEKIIVGLLEDGSKETVKTLELTSSNQWKGIFTNLPVYKEGKQIKYTIQELTQIEGYISEITGDLEEGYTIINSYTPQKIEIPVKKVWKDEDNQNQLRPNSIEIILQANGIELKRETLTGNTNEWTYTFTELPKYENGKQIKYTVIENNVPEEYASLISGDVTNGFTITNIHSPEKTSVKVIKVWEDSNNQDGLRPDSVTINLLGNEEVLQTIELNETNKWQHTFTELPQKMNGEEIIYTVSEINEIEGYTSEITGDSKTGFIITNKHEPYVRNISVMKKWVDEENFDQIRPTSVTVKLLADKVEVEDQQITLNAQNEWKYTFENLPVNKNGKEILYQVQETPIPTGYTVSIDGNMEKGYIITNTHKVNKDFDLALRKYIIKINNNELTTLGLSTRVPNISLATLETGTTATYKHRKDPIEVQEDDIVTYAITIYNEGEKAGYASQIIDQLPTGLIYNPSTTIISKDANGEEKNEYKVTYEASTNKVIFDIINTDEQPAKELEPFNNENLDSETIEIKCKVIYRTKAGESKILTNVAWISKAFDVQDNKTIITTIGDDRDSEPGTKPNVDKDNMEDYKGKDSNKSDLTDSSNYYEGEQDDDDFEKLYIKSFDLNLRKFISSINGNATEVSREPVVDVSPLKNGTGTTAIYNHPKTPIAIKASDTVVYTIRIYNEGEIDGYASEVKDYLSPYLEYVENSEINKKYGWHLSGNGRLATTKYLANKEIKAFNGTELDYEDLQIECKINENAIPNENITNIAEISEYKYGNKIYPEDVDSESFNIDENMPEDEKLPEYKQNQETQAYVPGYEDDDDFEKIYVKEFDLSLRKFITEVQEKEVTTRVPQVKIDNGTISYEHAKDVLTVHVGDVVIYTLRIYNEGQIDGYASEITDNIPEYLEYLPENSINIEYMWQMDRESQNVVKTKYLSKENGEDNLIKAYDGKTLSYKDIKIAFKVKDPNSNTHIIMNHAQISENTDEMGIDIKDKDSVPDKWNDGEDDQCYENIKVEYFDLSILKFVSKVIVQENGTEKITETGYNGHENPEPVVKVELHKKKLKEVVVKFGYGITVTNEGDVPGYATEITDYVPQGLKFDPTDNPEWMDEGNNVISTKQLEKVLLQPGQSKTIEVILTWINDPNNMAQKTNTVEISEDKNEFNVSDKDSIIDNKKELEDDIDTAKVILTISTGRAQTYFTLTLGLLGVIAIGIALIKKFVI